MKTTVFLFISLLFSVISNAQQPSADTTANKGIARPKLVVGIVIDQMRWDYLYRYYDLYKADGGFKRMLNNGFSCENTFIPYTPTVTAAGHACVYTGSVPAINGITGNTWYDRLLNRTVYCTEDSNVETVGSAQGGRMSPRNMITTTVGDELKLATNFKSKVIGIAIKDRGAILPAGHSADGAYWYDSKTGDFITSTYYTKTLPKWVQAFNNRKVADSLYKLNWNLFLPKETYPLYSTADKVDYEYRPFGEEYTSFPYNVSQFAGKDYGKIAVTPYGNTLTIAMAEAAVTAEKLGKSAGTDLLAVSFSSPDYIGHSFGPNSWEQLDDFVRLDAELGGFLDFLDANIGKNQYTVFLTSDHGAAHVPGFSTEHKLPGGSFDISTSFNELNIQLKQAFGKDSILIDVDNYQVLLNENLIASAKLDKEEIIEAVVRYFQKQPMIAQAFPLEELMETTLNSKQREMFANGYFPTRAGDIQLVLKPGFVQGDGIGTSHGLWNPYDSHIPLLWYGWGIKQGKTNRQTFMSDIAPTLSSLLHIETPSGCIGDVIEEVMK